MDSEQMSSQLQHEQHANDNEGRSKVSSVVQQISRGFQGEQDDSHVIVFINKLFKNNTSSKIKKIKTIRLNKFIYLLDVINKQFPKNKEDVELLYDIVISTLLNEKNFCQQEGIFIVYLDDEFTNQIGLQFAKVIENISRYPSFSDMTIEILEYLVNEKSISFTLEGFENKIRQSNYFQNINFDSTSYQHPFESVEEDSIFEIISIKTIILKKLNIEEIYSNLLKSYKNKQNVVQLFYQNIMKLQKPSKSKKKLLIETFLKSETLSLEQAQAILNILEKQIFDRQSVNEITQMIVTDKKLTFAELMDINFKKIKGIEQVYIQILLQQISKIDIIEVIDVFLNIKSPHNYFPLYLILKLNKKIPVEYVDFLFKNNSEDCFTLRKAIIFALSIVDNDDAAFERLLRNYSQAHDVQKYTKQALRSVHLSLQNISKANLIASILKQLQKFDLNSLSKLQFINYYPLRINSSQEIKCLLNKKNKEILTKLLGNLKSLQKNQNKNGSVKKIDILPLQKSQNEVYHKFRVDIDFLTSNSALVQQQIMDNTKQLNKLFDDTSANSSASMDQLLKLLPTLKQNLLEVVLMWINNRIQTYFSEDTNNGVIEWATKTYKKYVNELHTELKILMDKEKLDKYLKFIKSIIEYGIEKRVCYEFFSQSQSSKDVSSNVKLFSPQIKELMNSANSKDQRLNSNNYNQYFLTQSKWKNYTMSTNTGFQKIYKKIIWIKTIIIELKEFIRSMVKAQKIGNRKQIKNIITQNIDEILALKIIHEYFDAQIQESEGRQMVMQIFKTIQPNFESFERIEKLAGTLNIEYYSINQELPDLLENFNAETLSFLAQLLFNVTPKASTEKAQQKKKKNKKKGDKQNLTEQGLKCLQIIVTNFQLLFTDANCTQSYKSLFTILRKIIETQKITKQELAKNLNTWLQEITFFSCVNFQSWKIKVLSLCKMWKNMTDILGDTKQIQLKTLQKHFNMFTDLLNKLYENFREENQFLDVEQKILLSLCLIYRQLDFTDKIEQQVDMTGFVAKRFQVRNISKITLQNRYYYCNDCKKFSCYACSAFLHKNHDRSYIGKTGNCEHENPKPLVMKKQNSSHKTIEYSSGLFGGVSALLKRGDELPEQLIERIGQKISIEQQKQLNFFTRIKQTQIMRQTFSSQFSKSKNQKVDQIKRKIKQKQKQAALVHLQSQKIEQEQKDNNNEQQLTSTIQEFFQYREPFCKEFKKISPEFHPILPKIVVPHPKINVSPLAKVFLRQLQNESFIHKQKDGVLAKQSQSDDLLVQQIKEKYLFFKNNGLKSDNRDANSFGRGGRGGYSAYSYGQSQHPIQTARRNIISCSKKFLFYPISLTMMELSMATIKNKLSKKWQSKEYSHLEQQKNYILVPSTNINFEVLEISFSKSSMNPILAAIGGNQICFYPIQVDGKFSRMLNPEYHRIDNILKFTWINDNKNLFAIGYSNYIRIGGISPSNSIKTFAKSQVGKQIRDFDGLMNSKVYSLFIVDIQGKLYFVEGQFKQVKNSAVNPTDKNITFIDQNGNKLASSDIYSVKCIDGNRVLLSLTDGTIRYAQISRISNEWKVKTIDLKSALKSNESLVVDGLKIIKFQQQTIVFSGLVRKITAADNLKVRKLIGSLCIISYSDNGLEICYTKQENIQSYDYLLTNDNITMCYLNDEGSISFFSKGVLNETHQIQQKINQSLTSNTIRQYNQQLINCKIFDKIMEGGMIKNLQFKQNKILTNNFTIVTKDINEIKIKANNSNTQFITGLTIIIQLPTSIYQYNQEQYNEKTNSLPFVELQLKVLNSSYRFKFLTKSREIQIPFNIKETLALFASENDIRIVYHYSINKKILQINKILQKQLEQMIKIKAVNLYGFEVKDFSPQTSGSIYHESYKALINDWVVYKKVLQVKPLDHNQSDFEEYVNNIYRTDFYNIEMKRLYKMKYDFTFKGQTSTVTPGFKAPEINLFLKLQLLTQTIPQSIHRNQKQDIEQTLNLIKKSLLSRQHPRKSLENSTLRLCQVVCEMYEQKFLENSGQNHCSIIGNPYHKVSFIDFYEFNEKYKKWKAKKSSFSLFEGLINELSRIIFNEAINLYIIFQLYSNLMVQISAYFHFLISQKKHLSVLYSDDNEAQNSVTKLCSKFVSILCEYYQVLKNKENAPEIEEKILLLLENIFGRTKHDLSKEMVMHPFLYLQCLFCQQNQQIQIQTGVDLFNIGSIDFKQQSLIDFDINLSQINKRLKKQQSIQIQEQVLKVRGQNSPRQIIQTWQAMQQQKQLDQQQKQMYMDIEEDEFDEQQHAHLNIIEEVEQLDIESKKQKSDLKDLLNAGESSQLKELGEESNISKNLDEFPTKFLLSKSIVPKSKKITVKYFDFCLELSKALFRKQNYLTPANVYFYLGLFYNLLKIIEDNLKFQSEDISKNKVFELISAIDNKIESPEHSSLLMIVNFFVSPKFEMKNDVKVIKKSEARLAELFVKFYEINSSRFKDLLVKYEPQAVSKLAKFSDIMKYQMFQMRNQLYNLSFIANIYLCFRVLGRQVINDKEEREKVKEEMLFRVVKYRLPALRNVMIHEKWEGELDRAKILVSFEKIHGQGDKQIDEGINMLYECAANTPEKFIAELLKDQGKINFLEEFVLKSYEGNEDTLKKVFELIEIYYHG